MWFYNSSTGELRQVKNAFDFLSGKWYGPFDTQEKAQAFYDAHAAQNPSWIPPGATATQAGTSGALDMVKSAGTKVANAVEDLNPFHGINLQVLFVRIGEIILGVVLIGVAIAKLTGAENYITRGVNVAAKALI